MKRHSIFLYLLFAILILGCTEAFLPDEDPFYPENDWETISSELNLPRNPYGYRKSTLTSGLDLSFDRKATLGRVLFYDKSLSADGTTSCGSCHKQESAFADNVSFSKGVHGNLTSRNSYAIGSFKALSRNIFEDFKFDNDGFYWDNRENDFDTVLVRSLASSVKLDMPLDEVVSVVESKPYYQSLFKVAGRTPNSYTITSDHIIECLRLFIGTLNSTGSEFDKGPNWGGDFLFETKKGTFNRSENNGKLLFSKHCNQCHKISPFEKKVGHFNETFRYKGGLANNGLKAVYDDNGAGNRPEFATGSEFDGLFKVPDLRNVAESGPYMHDGSIKTLGDVLEHYSKGIQDHKNLSSELKDGAGAAKKFNFSATEKADIVNFLHTLTDPDLLTDEKWSNPFKE